MKKKNPSKMNQMTESMTQNKETKKIAEDLLCISTVIYVVEVVVDDVVVDNGFVPSNSTKKKDEKKACLNDEE